MSRVGICQDSSSEESKSRVHSCKQVEASGQEGDSCGKRRRTTRLLYMALSGHFASLCKGMTNKCNHGRISVSIFGGRPPNSLLPQLIHPETSGPPPQLVLPLLQACSGTSRNKCYDSLKQSLGSKASITYIYMYIR